MTEYPFPVQDRPVSLPADYDVPAEFNAVAERVWACAAAWLCQRPGSGTTDEFLTGQLRLVDRHARRRSDPPVPAVPDAPAEVPRCCSSAPAWFVGPAATTPELIATVRTLVGGEAFRVDGRFLPAAIDPDRLSIGTLTTAQAALRVAQSTQDAQLAWRAYEHFLTTRRELVRGDGSVVPDALYNPALGGFLRPSGTSVGSFSLAQALGLYGFGAAYRITHDRRLLVTASAIADYYLERTGDDLIPSVDWNAVTACPPDVAAAAAAATGFWQLAGLIEDQVRAEVYADYAIEILQRLAEPLGHTGPAGDGRGLLGTGRTWIDYCYLDTLDQVHQVDTRTHASTSGWAS